MNNNTHDKNDSLKLLFRELNEFSCKADQDRERRLWKQINKLSGISDAVGSLTKDEMKK